MGRSKRRRGTQRARFLLAILLGTAAVVLAIALTAYLSEGNWRRPSAHLVSEMGRANYGIAAWTVRLLGVFGGWLVPVALGGASLRLLAGRAVPGTGQRALVIALAIVVLASATAALPGGEVPATRALLAGLLGTGMVAGLRFLFGGVGAAVVLVGAWLAFLSAVGAPVLRPVQALARRAAPVLNAGLARVREALRGVRGAFAVEHPPRGTPAREKGVRIVEPDSSVAEEEAAEEEWEEEEGDEEWEDEEDFEDEDEEAEDVDGEEEDEDDVELEPAATVRVLPPAGEPRRAAPPPGPVEVVTDLQTAGSGPYSPPPLDFLQKDRTVAGNDEEREALVANAKVLETALKDFGVRGKVTQVEPGPVITRYEIEPAPGQKVAPIASLSDDLALALRARQIRIVAPIPGKAAVGIEVPNSKPRLVHLGSLLESSTYTDDSSKLNIALGRTISGEPFCVALDRLPHLLVAGSTGSGKSVCINTIIASILYRAGPEDVRFIMVDPKMLELTTYVGLPHLIPPVVSQPKDTVRILKWAVTEMEARYRTLAHVGVRSIVDHNARLAQEGQPKLPYLVVIIDELADLMLSNVRGEIEESIARLAQMARAVGIHLVLATQRPSVDVITGVIKANFPSRVAFQVPTRTDSRTILDSIGAERLLGRGDMLYLGVGMSAPMRVHGSYISTEETNDVVEWLKSRAPRAEAAEEPGPLDKEMDLFPRDRDDDLFEEAARILVAHQQGSISLLQRRLKVGYARAARLVDMMEEAGIVGPFTGSKAREILVGSLEDLEKKLEGRSPLGEKTGG